MSTSKTNTVALLLSVGFLAIAIVMGTTSALAQDEDGEAPCPTCEPVFDDLLIHDSVNGYIDPAILGTQVRLQADVASGGDRPDRAEFFYGKCLCFLAAAGQDAASPGPTQDLDFYELQLYYEYQFLPRASVFFEVPYRSIDLTPPPGFEAFATDEAGLADVITGFKIGLFSQDNRYLTLQTRFYVATGEAEDGLGTDHSSIEPALLFHARPRPQWGVDAELRLWVPLSGSSDPISRATDPTSPVGRNELLGDEAVSNDGYAGEVLRFGLGFSYGTPDARVTPVVELVGWHVLSGFATRDQAPFFEEADNETIVNLKLGLRFRAGEKGTVYVGYGAALTDAVWYDDIVRFQYRRAL